MALNMLLSSIHNLVKHSFVKIHYLSAVFQNTKLTQLETAKMSNLKMTFIKDINDTIFELFKKHIITNEVIYLNNIFKERGYEIVYYYYY